MPGTDTGVGGQVESPGVSRWVPLWMRWVGGSHETSKGRDWSTLVGITAKDAGLTGEDRRVDVQK